MALKRVVDDINAVPEAQRALYELKDGKYVLALEGDDPALTAANAKIVEFRDNNIAILKALGVNDVTAGITKAGTLAGVDLAKWAELKDVDPVKYKELTAKAKELEGKGVKGADDVAKVVQDALTAALKPMQDKLEASEAARAAAQKRSDEAMLRTAVGERFLKVGGKSKALDFIVGQAGNVFVVEDGQVKAKPNQFSAAKPGESIGIDEWLQGQAKENDFAFEPSGGGGASAGNGNGGAPRPGVRRVVNPTPEELGRFKFVAGKGLVDRDGQVVEIAEAS